MKQRLAELRLYKLRYLIGSILVLGLLFVTLVGATLYVPGGLRQAEIDTAVATGALSFREISPETIINLPYHALQWLSFSVFGVTLWSTVLPSTILAAGSLIVLYFLVSEWFRRSVAVIATGMAVTLPIFIFMAQDATPLIYTIFLSLMLLLTGTFMSRRRKPRLLWKSLFFVSFALNLYAPLGIYLNLALISTTIFHPHIRFLIRRLDSRWVIVGASLGLLTLIPLLYALTQQPRIALDLIGWPTESVTIADNAQQVALTLFDATGGTANIYAPPVISIGLALVLLIGFYRLIRIIYTARSYILFIWLLCLLPLIILNPERLPYLYPVIVLIAAVAIDFLIRSWYDMFPLNPYARFAGLIPLGLIVGGLFYSGFLHYTSAYYYDSDNAHAYSPDTRLFEPALRSIDATKDQPATIIVSGAEKPFYDLVARYREDVTIQTAVPPDTSGRFVFTRQATGRDTIKREPARIITSRLGEQADRFYTYRPAEK